MSKKANSVIIILFSAFIGGFFLINLLLPEKTFSEQENRFLQTMPEFSFSSLFRGDFIPDFESCCADQFAFRDRWITAKAAIELAEGKSANNGILYAEGGRLLKPVSMPSESVLRSQLDSAEALRDNTGLPVTLALIPGSAAFYADKLPNGADTDEEASVIEWVYENSALPTVDLLSPLRLHSDEYIFYSTDHHWTSLGAYYAYEALGDALDYIPECNSSPRTVSGHFYGTAYSSSGFRWVPADHIEVWREAPDALSIKRIENGNEESIPLYDESRLKTKDQYSFFLGGNAPEIVLETGNEGSSLLIVRDSFTDSLVPFLIEHFSEIRLIDLRYFRDSLKNYALDNGVDEVLILYSVENFCTDTSLTLLRG